MAEARSTVLKPKYIKEMMGHSITSARRNSDKMPLLYDSRYNRKDAYLKLHAFLLERSGLDKN